MRHCSDRRILWPGVALVALVLGACTDTPPAFDPVDLSVEEAGAVLTRIDVSRLDAAPGDEVRVAVALEGTDDAPVGALHGIVRFDPKRLAYVGQVPLERTLSVVNDGEASEGEVGVLSFKLDGLASNAMLLGFEVLAAGYESGLSFEPLMAVGTDADRMDVRFSATVGSSPFLSGEGPVRRALGTDELIRLAGYLSTKGGSGGPMLAFGGTTQIGDCNLDGAVNASDLVTTALIAVGVDAAPTDPAEFEICDVDLSSTIDVRDVVDVSRFAVGVSTLAAPVGFEYSTLTAGYYHTCMLDDARDAWCWGRNSYGGVGTGGAELQPQPAMVTGGQQFVSIRSAYEGTCGLDDAGQAYCWGYNGTGATGTGTYDSVLVPTAVTGGHSFVSLSENTYSHVCGVEGSGAAWCWGYGWDGQLGDSLFTSSENPVEVKTGRQFRQVSGGYYHTCGVETDGALSCWGYNYPGGYTSAPDTFATNVTFSEIDAGYYFTCGLDDSGNAWCWGDNWAGQLGDGTNSYPPGPVQVAGGLQFERLTVGLYHACALDAAGMAYCWGYGFEGQLGDGSTGNPAECGGTQCRNSPVAVSGGHSFTEIEAGYAHTCAKDTAGDIWCWGNNGNGQLGQSITSPYSASSTAPQTISGSYTALGVGRYHSCGVDSGALYCWGNNGDGQLGDGTRTAYPGPTAASTAPGATAVSGGRYHTCMLDGSGAAHCTGYNGYGQRGTGDYVSDSSYAAVVGGMTFAQITSGGYHTCGVRSGAQAGEGWCWGINYEGELGDGQVSGSYTNTPVQAGVSGLADISAGTYHTCAVTTGNALYCWGYNYYGQIGNGNNTNQLSPVSLSGAYADVDGGYSHTCGVRTNGDAYCWGLGTNGQLGDRSTQSSNVPRLVSGGLSFVSIWAGEYHTCGIDDQGDTYCWGRNDYGQLGDGTRTDRDEPTLVTGGAAFVELDLGYYHTCGREASGAGYCWGLNTNGQVGLGTFPRSLEPIQVTDFVGPGQPLNAGGLAAPWGGGALTRGVPDLHPREVAPLPARHRTDPMK